jgi:hypothetical protein
MRRRHRALLVVGFASAIGCANGGTEDAPEDAATDTIASDAQPASDSSATIDGDARADATDATDAAPDTGPIDPIAETLVGNDVPAPRVGMFYLVWHAPAATAMRSVVTKGGLALSIEDVLRSAGGAHAFDDVLRKWGLEGEAMSFYWQARPQLGFYCIYRARPGETGHVPDCPDIEKTLTQHAAQLVAAGVDHVVIDATNLTGTDPASDVLQLRPTEVLFEEWAKLRKKGVKTPQIAVWNAIPTGATQWSALMKLYSDPAYDGLVMHDKKTGKKVFFIVDPPDAGRFPDSSIIASIKSDGGKDDVVVQRMWTIDETDATIDRWAFMSWCHDGARVTTSIVGNGPCAQPYTKSSTLGSAIAVAPSFQTGYGSLPFGSAGKLSGLTFKRQWATAFAVRPEYVFISGWNEFIAQPQSNPFAGDPFATSMGLEDDPSGRALFVDTYGAELGRDIEPTVEYGTREYDLTKSCVRVFRKNAKTGATTCDDPAEACCDVGKSDVYANVWTLHHATAHDALLTTAAAEKNALVAGGGWREVCSRYGSPTSFCQRGDDPDTPMAPFIAFAAAGPGRKPLYRCLAGSRHFYTLDAACEGQTVEAVLAHLAETRSSEMPRRASRCYRASTGLHFVAIGASCPSDATNEGTLGYVR